MAECKHKWQGDSEGVKCLTCGKRLTDEEYLALFKPAKPKKKVSKTDDKTTAKK